MFNIQQRIINVSIIDIGYILFLCKLLSMTKQILKSIHTDNITKTVPQQFLENFEQLICFFQNKTNFLCRMQGKSVKMYKKRKLQCNSLILYMYVSSSSAASYVMQISNASKACVPGVGTFCIPRAGLCGLIKALHIKSRR